MVARRRLVGRSVPAVDKEHLGRLLDHAAHGDQNAFADFHDLTVVTALRLARAGASDVAAAETVVSSAYTHAWERGREFRPSGCSPLAWLLSLVRDASRPGLPLAEPG